MQVMHSFFPRAQEWSFFFFFCWAASISHEDDFCIGIHLCLIIVQIHLIRSNTSLFMMSVHGYAFKS